MRRTRTLLFGVLLTLVSAGPAAAASPQVSATLNGDGIKVSDIARYDCHDLDFPVIRCFSTAAERDAAVSAEADGLQVAAVTAVAYVTMYDGTSFTGASFTVSQNYDALAVIGWNDRASSIKGRNSETGRFNTDWFAGGSAWYFCCNQQTGNLGGYANTFSSVYRT